MSKTTLPDVIPRFRRYVKSHPGGGVLHVVLSDQNVEDHFVYSAIDKALEAKDEEGTALGFLLLRMSKTQRLKLSNKVWQ